MTQIPGESAQPFDQNSAAPAPVPTPQAASAPKPYPLAVMPVGSQASPAASPGSAAPPAKPAGAATKRGGGFYTLARIGAWYLLVVPLLLQAVAGFAAKIVDEHVSWGRGSVAELVATFFWAWRDSTQPLVGTIDPWQRYGCQVDYACYEQVDVSLSLFLLALGLVLVLIRARAGALAVYGLQVALGLYALVKVILDPRSTYFVRPGSESRYVADVGASILAGESLGAVLGVLALVLILAGLAFSGTSGRNATDPRGAGVGSAALFTAARALSIVTLVVGGVAAIVARLVGLISYRYASDGWLAALLSGPAPDSLVLKPWWLPREAYFTPVWTVLNHDAFTLVATLLLLVLGVVFVLNRKPVGAAVVYTFYFGILPAQLVDFWGSTYAYRAVWENLLATVSTGLTLAAVIVILVGVAKAPPKVAPPTPAEAAQVREQAAIDYAQRDLEWRAAELRRWEEAYKLAHSGEAPPPGFAPPIASHPAPQMGTGTNILAILALVFGILGGWIAIIFGHLAIKQIDRTGEQGRGMAKAGLILGYIGLAVSIIVGILWLVFVVWTSSQPSYY